MYNLQGGFIEYDVDFSGVHTGNNANFYLISPYAGFNFGTDYCDAQTSPFCLETDFIEANGHCGGQTAYHPQPGNSGQAYSQYKFKSSRFSMKASFSADGSIMTLSSSQFGTKKMRINPLSARKAVVMSSLWQGWVPMDGQCGPNGDLSSSVYRVSNVKIGGPYARAATQCSC